MAKRANLKFEPPNAGTWTLDNQHNPNPVSLFKTGFTAEFGRPSMNRTQARYGNLMVLTGALINGFSYNQAGRVGTDPDSSTPPSLDNPVVAERIARARQSYIDKSWQKDLVRWDNEIKPDSIERNLKLASIDTSTLDHDGLIEHIHQCRSNMAEMSIRHHMFTLVSGIPAGLLLMDAHDWTGLEIGDLLELLDGASPVSTGVTPEFEQVVRTIKADDDALRLLHSDQTASNKLDQLRNMDGPVGEATKRFWLMDGHRSVSGFDLQHQCALELPDIMVDRISAAIENGIEDRSSVAKILASFVRGRVPTEHQKAFDEGLEDARNLARLKDERGIYNDIWATGIVRLAILAAGRLLISDGILTRSEHLLEADWDEMQKLLRGVKTVTDEELSQRQKIRMSLTWQDAPAVLGPPASPPTPISGLPAEVVRMNRAASFMRAAVFAPQPADDVPDLSGTSASKGIHEGRARVVVGDYDFSRISQGDVLITSTHSEAFNAVAGRVGAIVADTGGNLSHLSIVSREIGIPCVVSCKNATAVIPEGALVRVDGDSGLVTILGE